MAYSDRDGLELKWGKENISRWADADNKGNVTVSAARIERFLTRASDYVDDRLRNLYAVPFASPYPSAIVDLCETLAGVMLYTSPRGLVDGESQSDQMQFHRDEVERLLLEICSGQRKLAPRPDINTAPDVVNVTL